MLKFGVWEYLQGSLLCFVMTESFKTNIHRNLHFWTFFCKTGHSTVPRNGIYWFEWEFDVQNFEISLNGNCSNEHTWIVPLLSLHVLQRYICSNFPGFCSRSWVQSSESCWMPVRQAYFSTFSPISYACMHCIKL